MSDNAQTGLRPPHPLTVTAEGMDVKWKLWLQQFRWYSVATQLNRKGAEIQVATFMNALGPDSIAIYNTFDLTTDQASDLDFIQDRFEGYFAPRVNESYASWIFLKHAQKETETFDDFMTMARTLIKSCNYGKLQDRMLRDKIVFGVSRDEIREKLLIETDLTLEKAILICRSCESATKQLSDMKRQTEKIVHAVQDGAHRNTTTNRQALQQNSGRMSTPFSNKASGSNDSYRTSEFDCRRCGRRHRPRRCPAFDKICSKCNRKGHFSKMCTITVVDEVNCSESADEQYVDELYVSSLQVLGASINNRSETDWYEKVRFQNNFTINAKLDSGAQCNAIGVDIAKKAKLNIRPSAVKRLVTFSHNKMNVLGEAECECYAGKVKTKVTFIVVDVPVTPVLGRQTCERLGFLVRVHSTAIETSLPPEAFRGLGKLTNFEYNIDFKENPVFTVHPPRRIALSLRSKVQAELAEMVRLGVISRVTSPTPAVSPLVVVQQKDKVRLCMDPTDLNKQILRRHFPMKTIEDIVSRLNGAQYFTLLDCRKGFWQIPVAKASRPYLTIATPWGRYQFNRVPFGIASAPELFQQIISSMLEDEDHAENSVDDILLFASTLQEIRELTSRVVNKLSARGIRFNKEKCVFYTQSVRFLGHVITKNGLAIDPTKVEAIQQILPPTGQKELQRFIGVINFVNKFIPDYSTITAPLRDLLKKDAVWCWDTPQQSAFNKLKQVLQEPPVLIYFNPNKSATLSVDASSTAVGAVLLQEGQPVAYATQSLTSAQKNYPQIEKEAFAIRFACKRFHEYVYGRQLVIETDHKPLEAISKKPLHAAPLRLQRIMFDILPYSPTIVYKPGTTIPIPDALSRDCSPNTQQDINSTDDEYAVHLVLPMNDNSREELRCDTSNDTHLQLLKKVILDGWPMTIDSVPQAIASYWNYRDELSCYDGILLKGERPIIPLSLHTKYLQLIHLGHLGIQSCLRRARDAVYWHGMSADIINYVQGCRICQNTQRQNDKSPIILHKVPQRPWQIIASDLFEVGGKQYLLLVDSFSGFYDFVSLITPTSELVIEHLRRWFGLFGIPEEIQTDNGPQYSSSAFKEFARTWCFTHTTSSPHYPQSNGLAERFVQTAKNLIRKCAQDSSDLQLALLNARNTPRPDLGSPAVRLFGRSTRSLLPQVEVPSAVQVGNQLLEARRIQKRFADPSRVHEQHFIKGQSVNLRVAPRQWIPATVTTIHDKPRSVVVTTGEGQQLRRNTSMLRPSPSGSPTGAPCSQSSNQSSAFPSNNLGMGSPATDVTLVPSGPSLSESESATTITRSGRLSKPPQRLDL